jgi:hypothetical protein
MEKVSDWWGWAPLPFGKILATPMDGRPLTMWPNGSIEYSMTDELDMEA